MWPLKNCNKYLKLVVSAGCVCGLVAVHYIYHLLAGEFLCAIIFGYMCLKAWGNTKPMHEIEMLWGVATPFLFGTIGAALDFSKINEEMVGDVILCIVIACIWRTISAYFSIYER